MARQPGKPKKGEPYRMHIILPGDLVLDVDAIASSLSKERTGLSVTRTDVARMAIHEYVKQQSRHMKAVADESNVLRQAALETAADWLKRFAKPREISRLQSLPMDFFRGEPAAPHSWWSLLIEKAPSLAWISDEKDALPDVGDEDSETRAALDDESNLIEFCETFISALP